MKKLVASLLFSLLSFSTFAADFSCQIYNLNSQDPQSEAVEMDVFIDTYNNEALLIGPDGMEEKARVQVARGTNKLYEIKLGSGTDTMLFFINTDSSRNLLDEYVQDTISRLNLSGSDVQMFEEKINERFGGLGINGTQVILQQVGGFLSCQKQ